MYLWTIHKYKNTYCSNVPLPVGIYRPSYNTSLPNVLSAMLSKVQSMREIILEVLEKHQPQAIISITMQNVTMSLYAFDANDYILFSHPSINGVDQLHLLVLIAPASEMNWIYCYRRYNCGARCCTSDLDRTSSLSELLQLQCIHSIDMPSINKL